MQSRQSVLLGALACALLVASPTRVEAVAVTVQNSCSYTIQLYDNAAETPLSPGASSTKPLWNGFVGLFRHGRGDAATLAEFSVDAGSGRPWYDISIIPPGPRNCGSLADCQRATGKVGFNVPMQIQPLNNIGRDTCRTLTCMSDGCSDAYSYPADNTKTHNCPPGTDFLVTFCPGGSGGPSPTVAPTTTPTTPTPTTPTPTTPTPTIPMPETPAPTAPTPTSMEPTLSPSVVTTNSTSSSASTDQSEGSSTPTNESGSADLNTQSPSPSPSPSREATPTATPTPTPSPSEDTVRANTQSSQDASSDLGLVIAVVIAAVGLVAGVVIVVMRHKKKLMEEREPKHSIVSPRNDYGLVEFHSPSNSVVL